MSAQPESEKNPLPDKELSDELVLMECGLSSVPQRLAEERGPNCRVLNLKENRLTNFDNLALFVSGRGASFTASDALV